MSCGDGVGGKNWNWKRLKMWMTVHFVEGEPVVDLLGFVDAVAGAVGGDVYHLGPCHCWGFVELSVVSSNVKESREKE